MYFAPSENPVISAFIQLTVRVGCIVLLLIAGSSAAAAYQVRADSEGNRIHLELSDRPAGLENPTFAVEATSTPSWIEITDTRFIPGKLLEVVIEFSVTGIEAGAAGELELLITVTDTFETPPISLSRKFHLTVGDEAPEVQRSYRIDECCIPTSGIATEPILPERHILLGNHPNPFSSATEIRFGLPRTAPVTLKICDITGRCIRFLKSPDLAAGYHQITWTGKDDQGRYVTPGVYFYQLSSENWTHSAKMLLFQ